MDLTRGEINLYVSDLERAAAFYTMGLGFEPCETAEGYRKLKQGDIVLTMFPSAQPGPAPTPGMVPHMSCDLQIADEDIEEAATRLKLAGAEVGDVTEWAEGRHLMFRDLDGIGWEILSKRRD